MSQKLLIFISFLISLSLASIPSTPISHSGWLNVLPSESAQLFYLIVESEGNVATDPVVLWMSGGPGCSGELALFYENGPWSVDADGNVLPNPFSWSKSATVIYVDQPPGTGFSFASSLFVHNTPQVADLMVTFTQLFFQRYPNLTKQDFYLFGESYGGHYVPAVALALAQAKAKDPSFPVTLKGIAIGNGLVDPLTQNGAQADFASDPPTQIHYEMKLINSATYAQVQKQQKACQALILKSKWDEAEQACGLIMHLILKAAGAINPMKVTDHCQIQDCFNYDNITNYLNAPAQRTALDVPADIFWNACNYNQSFYFTAQDQLSSFTSALTAFLRLVPSARLLIYHGDLDLVCPWNGGLAWMQQLQWPGQAGFNNAPALPWSSSGSQLGTYQAYSQLTFIRVFGGGHMTPHDTPQAALDLFTRFIHNRPFGN